MAHVWLKCAKCGTVSLLLPEERKAFAAFQKRKVFLCRGCGYFTTHKAT